jgi:carbonic anhydrase/acetyltransferase-like protein (isoleucine patch superfamily)
MTRYQLNGIAPETADDQYWIAPNATLIGRIRLEHNASVWFNATLRGDTDLISIGENSNVQDGSVLHTDPGLQLIIGKDVTVGHMVMLHGCTIGDNTLIGIGSIILNRTRIGKNCLIGANTFIPEGKEIPDNSFVIGSPGQVVKQTTDAHIAMIKASAGHYVENWKRYKAGLIAQAIKD